MDDNDDGSLMKLLGLKEAQKLLDMKKEAEAKMAEVDAAKAALANSSYQFEKSKDDFAHKTMEFMTQVKAHDAEKAKYAGDLAALAERRSHFEAEKKDFDARKRDVVSRETALQGRDQALRAREDAVAKKEMELNHKLGVLKSIV